MGTSSAWFPFHSKASHTSSGTEHCIKLISYPIETHRGIKHRHIPFFTSLLGKVIRVSGDTGNAPELWKSTQRVVVQLSMLCDAKQTDNCSTQRKRKMCRCCKMMRSKHVGEKDDIPLTHFYIVNYFQFCWFSFSFLMTTSLHFLPGRSL